MTNPNETTWHQAEMSPVSASDKLRELFEEQLRNNGVTAIYLSGQIPTPASVLDEVWGSMGRRLHAGMEMRAKVQPPTSESVQFTEVEGAPPVNDPVAMQKYMDRLRADPSK